MKKITTKKMALTAMLACLAFVLNTFVYFPAMAPFQHFVDVLAASSHWMRIPSPLMRSFRISLMVRLYLPLPMQV